MDAVTVRSTQFELPTGIKVYIDDNGFFCAMPRDVIWRRY